MNKFILPLVLTGLSIAFISTPAVYADTDDAPSFILTIMCTVYGESPDDFAKLVFGLDGSDCSIQTEHPEVVEDVEPTKVILSEGSLFPACLNNNNCFVPDAVTISAGETVVWVNEDSAIHTVTSDEPHPDGVLDDWINPGDEYEFTFDTVGEYHYSCVIHPWATGVVIVKSADLSGEDDRPMEVMNELIAQYNVRSDAIIKYINESVGELYDDVSVFAVDRNDQTIVAHSHSPAYIGVNTLAVLSGASIPADALIELLDTQTDGVWISYPVPDPTNPAVALFYERGWFQASGDYYFGVRYSISDEAFSQNIVRELIRVHELNPENTIEFVNSIQTTDTSYPFILSPVDYTILAHGSDPTRVGDISVSLTASNKSVEVIIDELQNNEGTWVEYVFTNPSTGLEQNKRSWHALSDGLIFGSGYYLDDSMTTP